MASREQPLTRHHALAAGSSPRLRLAVVADTHGAPHPSALAHLRALAPDAILHAGDVGDLAVLEALAGVAPLFAVRGNIDGRTEGLPDVLTLDLSTSGRALRLLLTHIAVAGPRLRADAARSARAAHASLVVCGHSHVPFIGVDRGLTIFNPGSLGPRRFHLPIVFGVLELGPAGVSLWHVDAASGQRWAPGLPA
jgi:putative phosphoesterase